MTLRTHPSTSSASFSGRVLPRGCCAVDGRVGIVADIGVETTLDEWVYRCPVEDKRGIEAGVGGSVRASVGRRLGRAGGELVGDTGFEGTVGSRRRTTDPEERARQRDGGVPPTLSISLSSTVGGMSTPSSVTDGVCLLVVGIHDNRGDDLDR